jgi:hypothetical protein
LRNIYDYAYLGDLSIVSFRLIKSRLSTGDITHADRGKEVNKVLIEA